MATQRTRKRESIDRLVGVSETVALPEIKAFQKLRVGAITRIIRGSTIPTVTNMESFDVPGGDGQAAICTFETGEEYLLSLKKIVACPEGLDGVVYRTKAGTWVWASHKSLASFSASSGDDDSEQYKSGIADAFQNCLRYRSEVSDTPERPGSPGLRAPQLGALHSIVGYWTLESDPCTVVMPTGTGKTEVMLATTVNVAKNGAVLVVVPTAALREQTMGKLTNWGLLRRLGIIPEETPNPIVGIIEHRPRNTEDLDIFERCHVVVATMTSLTQGTAEPLLPEIAARVSTLVIDEAHHIGARTWTQFREAFFGKRILQLTATPFRRDGKLVDGKVIFSYSLARAQQDGHFKPIEFKPVFDFDAARGDEAIASEAVTQLADDLTGGYEHLIMARCDTVARAKEVVKIYERLAPQYHPVLIHSGMNAEGRKNLDALKSFDSRIAVCVNMLGEGFDLPNLKIAAVHDPHKSLAVLLQFAGRFTRSSGHALGKATVIANIADQDMSESLDRLYQEDADWNSLLSEFSSTAAKQHRELVQFLNESARLHGRSQESVEISNTLLHPKCSAAVYRCSKFDHESFFKSLSKRASVQACWYHSQSRTLYFVTRRELKVDWTRSKELHDVSWDLFILHYQEQNGLLYVASSDKSSLHENLAKQVGGEVSLIRGDKVFRAFSEISRLRFNQIGVKKAGRRNLSYAMYTGSDVQQALTVSQRSNAYKSNLAGSRFRNGEPANVGCSYKGRVWSMDRGSVRTFIDWCETVGDKLLDESIDTEALIKNVLVLEELHQLPDSASVLSVDWPAELRRSSFERSVLKYGEHRDDL
ncbi:MAG: DEAD/DEAH box helicase family protein, partial [Planctomycetota bacterium]